MTFFYIYFIPAWIPIVLTLLCIFVPEMIACQIIIFLSEHAIPILAVIGLLFLFILWKTKDSTHRQLLIAFGIGTIPLFAYLWRILPILYDLTMNGSLIRLLFSLVGFVFEVTIITLLGQLGLILFADRRGDDSGVLAILASMFACVATLFLYFVVYL